MDDEVQGIWSIFAVEAIQQKFEYAITVGHTPKQIYDILLKHLKQDYTYVVVPLPHSSSTWFEYILYNLEEWWSHDQHNCQNFI